MREFFAHLLDEFQLPLASPVLVFSVILLIILLSPILLRRLNIPGIIGLIISGVIIGPNGLNVLEKNSAIDLFSTIGLLYIMFIAGLDLDLQDFRSQRNRSLLFGLLTFAIPMGIGFPVCTYVLGYEFNASLLTSSMFATHTLVAYPIVSRMGITKNQAVAVAVGGTILTDTAVLILLSVILGNAQGEVGLEFWLTFAASLATFAAIMFVVVPRIAKWFFRKLESEKHSHYIFVLAVVFFAAFLAEVAGVEKIIGAFVAGLALNKLIPHSSALMNRIEFIGNSLFIPFFLISVGMVVDVRVLLNGPTALIVAGVLTATALLGKWLAAGATALAFGYSGPQRQLLFGLSGAHAAATLAIILVGYDAGILDEYILNGTILLILATCVVASFATERAAKHIATAPGDEGAQRPTRTLETEHLLLPVSRPEDMGPLLEFAALIKEKRSPNPVSVLTVVTNDEEAERNLVRARAALDGLVRQASATETKVNAIATIDLNTASGIARISREIMADAIVLGWPERSGPLEKLFGEKLAHLLAATDKTIAAVDLRKPLVVHKRLFLVVPPFAERESGFPIWVHKLARLGTELSIPLEFRCTPTTQTAIEHFARRTKLTATLSFAPFDDWDDFLVLARDIRPDDFLIVVSARRSGASWISALEGLPARLDKYFSDNNRLLIFPEQFDGEGIGEQYEDFIAEPLNKGLETVQRLSRGLGSLLGRGSGRA
jgi:Kef-type K+ transport system membrane component KefB